MKEHTGTLVSTGLGSGGFEKSSKSSSSEFSPRKKSLTWGRPYCESEMDFKIKLDLHQCISS